MKRILLLLIVTGSSVSFNAPIKKNVQEEVKKENLNMLMIKYRLN
jgi:hypothetical protein